MQYADTRVAVPELFFTMPSKNIEDANTQKPRTPPSMLTPIPKMLTLKAQGITEPSLFRHLSGASNFSFGSIGEMSLPSALAEMTGPALHFVIPNVIGDYKGVGSNHHSLLPPIQEEDFSLMDADDNDYNVDINSKDFDAYVAVSEQTLMMLRGNVPIDVQNIQNASRGCTEKRVKCEEERNVSVKRKHKLNKQGPPGLLRRSRLHDRKERLDVCKQCLVEQAIGQSNAGGSVGGLQLAINALKRKMEEMEVKQEEESGCAAKKRRKTDDLLE